MSCIIDCTEIFIDRANNLTARAQTWSNYKHHNRVKYLVGVTPAGAVSFLSAGWGGRVSDKEIRSKSGFFELLEHKDELLSDRGFLIREDLQHTVQPFISHTSQKARNSSLLMKTHQEDCQM